MPGLTDFASPAIRVYNPESKIERGVFTAQLLLQGYAVPASSGKNFYNTRKALYIKNCEAEGGKTFYWGGTGVNSQSGIPLKPGESISFDFTTRKNVDIMVIGTGVLAVAELL